MNNMVKFSFEPAYRQLGSIDRAFVDELVARIESMSERTGRDMGVLLAEYQPVNEREMRHLQNTLVCSAISDRVRALIDAQNISARRITKEIVSIAFSTIDSFRNPGASITGLGAFDLDRATPEQRSAVKKVKYKINARTGQEEFEFEMYDKLSALRMLGQAIGLFNNDGDAANPEKWADSGIITEDDSTEDAAQIYARFIDEE